MRYNVIIINPFGFEHTQIFLELGQLVYYSLAELSYEVTLSFSHLASDIPNSEATICGNEGINILLGAHLLEIGWLSILPKSSIILNTEQISAHPDTEKIIEFARRFETWDYSLRNIENFRERGINGIKHLRLGYQKELNRIVRAPDQDIDVLFYGSIAPGDRREVILNALRSNGLIVHRAFGLYGAERDQIIARSKVVINIHFYDTHIFESIRVFYLLTNSIPVVGEVNESTIIDPIMKEGIVASPYEKLVQSCVELVQNSDLRESVSILAYKSIAQFPQIEFTASVLQ